MSLIVIGAWAEKSENEPIIGMTCTPGKISFNRFWRRTGRTNGQDHRNSYQWFCHIKLNSGIRRCPSDKKV